MHRGLRNSFAWYSHGLLCLLVALTGCAIDDLPKRVFPVCLTPSAQIGSAAQLLTVNFTLESTTGTIGTVNWDFGDGRNATALSARHVFAAPGTYTVSARLTNNCGDAITVSRSVIVDNTVPPIVSTLEYTPGYSTANGLTATLRMVMDSKGNGKISRYGICYSFRQGIPTVSDANSFTVGTADDLAINTPVSFTVGQVPPGTYLYFRGFAINNADTGYGSVVTVLTSSPASVTTTGDTLVGTTTASVAFKALDPGNPPATKYGICYSATSNAPTLNTTGSAMAEIGSPTTGVNTRLPLTNLQPNTKYYYRAFATSALGTIYSQNTLSFTTQTDVDVTTGLVGAYSFSGNGLDASGNNNNGTLKNGASYGTDRRGNAGAALQLDGVSGYFDIPDAPGLRPATISVSVWIKPATLTRIMQIYNKSNVNDGTGEQYSSLMKLPATGSGVTINVDIKQGGNCETGKGWQTSTFSSGLLLNTWHHLVAVYDGTRQQLYFDGNLLTTDPLGPAGSIDNCPGGSLKFGTQYKGFDNYFNGAIDDIRIYNRALTDVQVKALFNQ